MTATCTVTVNASGGKCGEVAVVERETMFGEVAECAAHVSPTFVRPVVTNVGRRVQVRHGGIVKVGEVVRETARGFEVRVPVKPHGKAATTKVVKVEEVIRFV